MRTSWSTALTLANVGYRELAFQAIYAYRQGNEPTSLAPETIVATARRRVFQSKALVAGFFGFISLGTILVLNPTLEAVIGRGMPVGLYVGAVLTALLLLEIVLFWWTSLQILPTALTSGVGRVLETLPVDSKTLDRASFLIFLRLFDLPAATLLVLTPLSVGIALAILDPGGAAWVGAIALVPGVVVAEILALALAIKSAEFFVHHVQGTGGGSRRTVARWVYLVAWSVPAFSIYGFFAVVGQFLRLLQNLATGQMFDGLYALYSIFPVSFGMIVPYLGGLPAVGVQTVDPFGLVLVVGAVGGYSALFYWAGRWLVRAPRRLFLANSPVREEPAGAPRPFVARSPSVAVMTKDLRIASRTPAFAVIVIVPLLQALALGSVTLFSSPADSRGIFSLGVSAVASAALLATFFGPAFFAVEVIGQAYTRSLPLRSRSLVAGKVLLVVAIYLGAAGIVLGLTAARIGSPLLFLAFALAELPAMVAAALAEFGILVRRSEKRGIPIVNLYSSAWTALAVSIPGLAIVGLPLLLYSALAGATSVAILVMAVTALLELSVALALLSASRRPEGAI
ncbi:MAG TPA: hypothetical protein VFF67_02895 [Thermoplasmata archaeon]|nr:hypothetical protein [Thermoplasmata archaeon]